MALQDITNLQTIGEGLIDEFEGGPGKRIESQILETGRPSSARFLAGVEGAGEQAQQAFDVAEGTLERQQRALTGGAAQDPRLARVQKRKLGLARALADVDARNKHIRSQQQQQRTAQQGAIGLRGILDQQLLSGTGNLASAETAREVTFEEEKQAEAAERAALIGGLAGIATSFIPGGALVAPFVSSAVSGAVA